MCSSVPGSSTGTAVFQHCLSVPNPVVDLKEQGINCGRTGGGCQCDNLVRLTRVLHHNAEARDAVSASLQRRHTGEPPTGAQAALRRP